MIGPLENKTELGFVVGGGLVGYGTAKWLDFDGALSAIAAGGAAFMAWRFLKKEVPEKQLDQPQKASKVMGAKDTIDFFERTKYKRGARTSTLDGVQPSRVMGLRRKL